MDVNDKEFVVNAIRVSNASLIDQLNNKLIKQLNGRFDHVSKRIEDVENRLAKIEGKLHIVSKDTSIIPDIFSMLEEDGMDIAKLEKRITKLEK